MVAHQLDGCVVAFQQLDRSFQVIQVIEPLVSRPIIETLDVGILPLLSALLLLVLVIVIVVVHQPLPTRLHQEFRKPYTDVMISKQQFSSRVQTPKVLNKTKKEMRNQAPKMGQRK
jgi:hypothetical protein